MTGMTIGALARRAGVSVETIRYYQRCGLLATPLRPADGYRRYSAEDLRRTEFIKRVQRLGFTLAEIAELLTLQFEAGLTCEDMTRRAGAKVAAIEQKIAALSSLRDTLIGLAARCQAECTQRCTVLIDLEPIGPAPAAPPSAALAWLGGAAKKEPG